MLLRTLALGSRGHFAVAHAGQRRVERAFAAAPPTLRTAAAKARAPPAQPANMHAAFSFLRHLRSADVAPPHVPSRQVLLDQLTFGPLNNIAFLSFLAVCVERGAAVSALPRRLAADLPRVQRAAWRFWPLVAALNYRVRPARACQFTLSWAFLSLARSFSRLCASCAVHSGAAAPAVRQPGGPAVVHLPSR